MQFAGSAMPETYKNMIYSKWLRSLRYGNDYFRLIDADSYYRSYNIYIESILKRSNLLIRLAVLTDNHDVVLGFSVIEEDILHYCHTHKDIRRQGIARSLVKLPINFITHLTKTGMIIWNAKLTNAAFNPFL